MTVAFTVCIALLMLLACQLMAWYAGDAAERNAHTLLEATARKVADDLTDDEHRVPLEELPEEEREILRPDGIVLLVLDSHGDVVEHSPGAFGNRAAYSHSDWRFEGIPFGTHRVLLALPWRNTERALRHQRRMMLLLGLFVTFAASVGAWLLVGRTLSPIAALSRQAQSASADNLSLRLKAPSRDAEIVGLVGTLNGLLERVAVTIAAKSRFHAAASHELRTPLQVLSGQLELALHRERTGDEYRAFIVEADCYTKRLTALTRDLLLLHQLDAAQPAPTTDVDLADICDRVLRQLAARIEERSLEIQVDIPHDARLEAPPTHAEMLTRNLIENAVRYASPASLITVTVRAGEAGTRMRIVNRCETLGDDNPERWFEPFYRPDASRKSETGGAGLGLAICKALADANGWALALWREGNDVCASVVFS